MSFSIGEDVNKNLLKIGDKMSKNTENSFNDTYALQARLSNWFKNNPGEVGLKGKIGPRGEEGESEICKFEC